jgi:putative ABC transport system ATP-binding protein
VTHNKELAKIAHHVVHLRDGSITREERNKAPLLVEELEW